MKYSIAFGARTSQKKRERHLRQYIHELFGTYSMKGYCIIIYFALNNDARSIVKICTENTSRWRVFSVKFDYASNVISMFKMKTYNSLSWNKCF